MAFVDLNEATSAAGESSKPGGVSGWTSGTVSDSPTLNRPSLRLLLIVSPYFLQSTYPEIPLFAH